MNNPVEQVDILLNYAWPLSRLGEALAALAEASGLPLPLAEIPNLPQSLVHSEFEPINRWVEAATDQLGIEAEPLEILYRDVDPIVQSAGPALLPLPTPTEPHLLALLRGRRGAVTLLDPNLIQHTVKSKVVRAALCSKLEARLANEVDQVLAAAQIPPARYAQRAKARAVMLAERLGSTSIGNGWLVRLPPGAHPWSLAREAELPSALFAFIGAYLALTIIWLLTWWVLGQMVFQGYPDSGWLAAWVLLLISLLPFRLLQPWFAGLFSIKLGSLLKRRLLYGAMRLEPEEIRHSGVGQHLARVVESEALEQFALDGGVLSLMRTLDLLLTLPLLVLGAGGWLHALALIAWSGFLLGIGWRYFRQRSGWTEQRLRLTHDLIERMVGHRTRLAQESPERWHRGEDQMLERYLKQSVALDRTTAALKTLAARGWLILSLLALAPALISGQTSLSRLALGLGGALFAYQSFGFLAEGLMGVMDAAIAWEQVALLFHAAARPTLTGSADFAVAPTSTVNPPEGGPPLVEADGLFFRYRDWGEPVLQNCHLRIAPGDHLLLEGPSGGGKSTLVSLLTGLRVPESGLLLLHGLDHQTLGAMGWRRRVVAAPQFHENHIFTETFAFNLLMGRRWPPEPADLQAATLICQELGLAELIDKMPAGLSQMVGETGWQLSHGERSRLYIARALLQNADLILLDESFAALDPETLRQCLRCVLNRASTLLVIAHP
jgi:ATP-binding cassette subfamily B protein